MPCFRPMKAWYSREINKSGKRGIVFNPAKGYSDMPVDVPCGKCIGCKLEYSRSWAQRITNEASMYDENCFLTLTYDDNNIPEREELHKQDFTLFMKRLRKYLEPDKVRYFQCGEYGDKFGRPHHHVCLFGYSFNGYAKYKDSELEIEEKEVLQKIWGKGFVKVGELTFESAAYVARYVAKKALKEGEDHLDIVNYKTGEIVDKRVPEYCTMSRRPGIGAKWIEKYMSDTYKDDSVVSRGRLTRPPKYYDKELEKKNKEVYNRIKQARVDKMLSRKEIYTDEYLRKQEKRTFDKTKLFASGRTNEN